MSNTGNYKASPEFLALAEKHKQEKAFQITEEITSLAKKVVNIYKAIPKDGKRNPFVKSYSRRPGNKRKRAIAKFNIAVNTRLSITRVYAIASQPIPRFPKGGMQTTGPAYVGGNNAEVIQRLNGELINVPIPTLR